jgi:hypothetical protein
MAATAQENAAAIQSTAQAVQGLDAAAQTAAIEAVVPPPDATTANDLWKKLVVGLMLLVAIALGGVIYLVVDEKDPDVVLSAFTGLLGALIGLFAKSPSTGGSGS